MRISWLAGLAALALAILALAACVTPPPLPADEPGRELIANGNFAQAFDGWSVSSTTVRPASVRACSDRDYAPFGDTTGASPAGTFAAFNGGDDIPNGILSQTISTRAGATYVLAFAFGTFDASGKNNLQALDVVVSSDLKLVQTFPIPLQTGSTDLSILFKSYAVSFVAVGTTSTITFIDRSPDTRSVDGLLTKVSLKRR